jgi:DNA-binding transcriptional regulator/RsmH inhibitor MraZ
VVDWVEERLQVDVHYPAASRLHIAFGLVHRVMRAALRAKAVAVGAELRIECWGEQLQDRLLDEAVQHRWDS